MFLFTYKYGKNYFWIRNNVVPINIIKHSHIFQFIKNNNSMLKGQLSKMKLFSMSIKFMKYRNFPCI